MSLYVAPEFVDCCHWYVRVPPSGEVAVTKNEVEMVAVVAVSEGPTEIVGVNARARITVVTAEIAEVESSEFVAMTITLMKSPLSADVNR